MKIIDFIYYRISSFYRFDELEILSFQSYWMKGGTTASVCIAFNVLSLLWLMEMLFNLPSIGKAGYCVLLAIFIILNLKLFTEKRFKAAEALYKDKATKAKDILIACHIGLSILSCCLIALIHSLRQPIDTFTR